MSSIAVNLHGTFALIYAVAIRKLFTALTASIDSGLPLVQSLYQAQDTEQMSLPVLRLWLLLMGWNLLVVAHIIRHALSVILPIAVLIAVLYTLVAMQLITALFPQAG